MSAREQILGAVRRHLARADGAIPAPPPAPPPVPLLGAVDLDTSARLDAFAARLEAVGGHCHRGPAALVVAELVARYRPRRIASSDSPLVDELSRAPQLAGANWLPADAATDALFASDLGVTAAQWGIAESGTLVLDSSAERHRLASLLPPVHVALLPASRVLANLGELLKTVGRPLPTAVTFITGPSRTADIELQLVLGVHGPRQLHVVLT
ncbi:MAG: lactate utilization protein C [Planctomycetes bacterium]|nr:lactate utilization protein C [Planctomycetota bacterium]